MYVRVHACMYKELFFSRFVQVDEIDEKLLRELSYQARGDLCPMQGVIGGITAQEVMKVWLQEK